MIEDEATAAVDTRHDQTIQVSTTIPFLGLSFFHFVLERDDETAHYSCCDCSSNQHGRAV